MCYEFLESPFAFPFYRETLNEHRERILYLPILAKRVDMLGSRHVSATMHSFTFPLRSFVWDQNAIIGSHDRCLHLAPNPLCAQELQGFGDHTLVVIPSKHYWSSKGLGGRCHHTNGVYPLFCVECEGYRLEETTLPEFWNKEIPQGLIKALLAAAEHGA